MHLIRLSYVYVTWTISQPGEVYNFPVTRHGPTKLPKPRTSRGWKWKFYGADFYGLYQGWQTYGTRAQYGARHSMLSNFVFHFFCPTTHISDRVETVFELPLLPNNTASETFVHKSEQCEVLTGFYHSGASLAVTGRIRDIGNNVL